MSALPKEQDDGALQIQKNFLHGSVFIVHFVLVPFSSSSIRSVWCDFHCVSILLTWCALCWRSQSNSHFNSLAGNQHGSVRQGVEECHGGCKVNSRLL